MTDKEDNKTLEHDLEDTVDPITETACQEENAADFDGVKGTIDDPDLEPAEEEKYVYQKGDFLALLIAAVKVFAPIVIAFVGGIWLVYFFFAR